MWIFLNDSFLSIIAADDADHLVVRARRRGDIRRVFGNHVREVSMPGRDYAYRATLPRGAVMAEIAKAIADIDYTNFKDSVEDNDRHDAYLDVWEAMFQFQKGVRKSKTIAKNSYRCA